MFLLRFVNRIFGFGRGVDLSWFHIDGKGSLFTAILDNWG
jgi:hypothetical protein